jgi:hypothetical protein
MIRTNKFFGAAAMVALGSSIAPSASARSEVAWVGAANPRGNDSCFTESFGKVTNSGTTCGSGALVWEMALPVDSAGIWNVTVNVTPTSDMTTIHCRAFGVNADASVQNLSVQTQPTTPSAPQNLQPMLVNVPSAGALYAACWVSAGATVNTVNWNTDPLTGTSLNVPLFAQLESNWCWAASGEMIFSFFNTNVSQCSQANQAFSRTDCCQNPSSSACNQGSSPNFSFFGFNATSTGTALTFAQLQTEFAANRPVEFEWNWNSSSGATCASCGAHAMVAVGTDTDASGVQYVSVNDPESVAIGDQWVMTYSDWVTLAGPGGGVGGGHSFKLNNYQISKK